MFSELWPGGAAAARLVLAGGQSRLRGPLPVLPEADQGGAVSEQALSRVEQGRLERGTGSLKGVGDTSRSAPGSLRFSETAPATSADAVLGSVTRGCQNFLYRLADNCDA